jgi:hypothetical protein
VPIFITAEIASDIFCLCAFTRMFEYIGLLMVIISPSVGALLPALNIWGVFSILMYLLASYVYGQGEFRGRRRVGPRVLTSVLNAHVYSLSAAAYQNATSGWAHFTVGTIKVDAFGGCRTLALPAPLSKQKGFYGRGKGY